MKKLLPFLDWLPGYNAEALRADLVAGVTVALVLVPQSMAYAQLAGLPAYYGLYAAFLPPMVANLFGSSRQLATGPVAVVSLMTAAALEPLATAGSEQYVAYAIMLALMVGLFQLALGALRLGLVVNLLSHPVVNGFTNAAALIIATSQLGKIFGVSVDKAEHHYETVYEVIRAALRDTHMPTLAMAVLAFAIMFGLRRLNPRIPNVLAAVVVTTLLSAVLGFERDDRAPLDRINPATVQALVAEYNASVHKRQTLEEMRAQSYRAVTEVLGSQSSFCLRCHPERDLHRLESREKGPAAGGHADRALALHSMAGLLDDYIEELKQTSAAYRAELRAKRFVRVLDPDGTARFYTKREAPATARIDGGTWRIRVGGNLLDAAEVTMAGGGAVVGTIPEGLPVLRLPWFEPTAILQLLAAAVIISILGFMEAISIAKAMAARTRQRLDPNQELIGQGLANIVGCFSQSYAVSGSFSRSAVNLQAGGRTGLSNVFSSLVVAVVLLFLTGLLYNLPQAVLAAIIMMAVFGLLNISGFVHAWRTRRFDGVISIVTFVATLATAPHLEWGIFLGVALSLGGYMFRTMRPTVQELSPHPDGSFRDARRHGLKTCRYIALIGFDGPLNFASTSYLEDEILGRVADFPDLRHVLLAGEGITEIDASGEETLRHLVERLRTSGYQVSFAGLNDEAIAVLKRSHLYDVVGEEHFFSTRAHALATVYGPTHRNKEETDCPFRRIVPRVTELSLHPDESLRDADRYRLPLCRHVTMLRIDDRLTLASTKVLEETILARVRERPEARHVILVAHGVADIEPSAASRVGRLVQRLTSDGYTVSFSGLNEDILGTLKASGVDRIIGERHMHPTQVMALAAVYARAHQGSAEDNCPLRPLSPRFTELSLHSDGALRAVRRHHLDVCRHIGVLRMDGPFLLVEPEPLILEYSRWAEKRPEVTHILMVADTINHLTPEDADSLVALAAHIRQHGQHVYLGGLHGEALDSFAITGCADRFGVDQIYTTDHLALAAIFGDAHATSDEEDCPLRRLMATNHTSSP